MEVGFLVIMICLALIVATIASLVDKATDRKCGNCEFFKKTPGSKHMGKCQHKHSNRTIVFDYEVACKYHHQQNEEE